MDAHDPDQECRGRVRSPRCPSDRCPRLAHKLWLDDGPMADVCEPRERWRDGPVRRSTATARVRRLCGEGRSDDARRRPEACAELEGGWDDGRARLEPDPAPQLDRGALDSRGDVVPHVPRWLQT